MKNGSLHPNNIFPKETAAPTKSRTVHLVCSWAPLLSGGLDECLSPDDETCVGGVAAVSAYLRHYGQGEPSVVVPFADRQSPFVQMHPLVWNVNRLVLQHILGWNMFAATPSILTQNKADYNVSNRDLSDLQSKEFPLLLTNVAIPPSHTWFQYAVPVYFDHTTGLAILSLIQSNEPLSWDQVESAKGVLDYVARVNAESGCGGKGPSLYDTMVNKTVNQNDVICWIPVVIYGDVKEMFQPFLEAIIVHENPPELVIDVEQNWPTYVVPRRIGSNGPFLVSYYNDDSRYFHHTITLSEDRKRIQDVKLIADDLENLNSTWKDEKYRKDIVALRKQADLASQKNPVVGLSTFMPVTGVEKYRRCQAGECEIGNLFTDAQLWWADADVSFSTSGGLRGLGWPAGDVRISNIWKALPYPNNPCTGVMNGVSLFKLFNYSINAATFEGENTMDGDRLLQVSGMKILFNKQLDGRRVIAMRVWDKKEEAFLPVDRLKLYKFVTDSFVCSGFDPYPVILGKNLTSTGEIPGSISDALLVQNIVADYLQQLDGPYQVGINGRLVNDTSAMTPLNLIQNADDCPPGTSWQAEISTCIECPDRSHVAFLSGTIEFEGANQNVTKSILLVNSGLVNVAVVPKSKPSWLTYAYAELELGGNSTIVNVTDGVPNALRSGERMVVYMDVIPGQYESGTAQGMVAFGVLDGGNPGCTGQDATFEVIMRVLPKQNLNQLGQIRYFGFSLAGVAVLTALFFTGWVWRSRNHRLVKTLQPVFLLTISVGVLVMSLAIIPLSIDDQIASTRVCDITCMSTPWVMSLGFVMAMSALFSKLWRINKLFGSKMRRMIVTERDAIAPFVGMFTSNATFLIVWTIVEPLQFVRVASKSEPWNTYGVCRSKTDGTHGVVALVMMILVGAVNAFSLCLACYQAYQARNISDEFSESRSMGIALFSWFQLLIVGVPVLYLIDDNNPGARYFLQVLLLFSISMSMLLLIYMPMVLQVYKERNENTGGRRPIIRRKTNSKYSIKTIGTTRISGLDDFGVANFIVLSKELGKLPFDEHRKSQSDTMGLSWSESHGHAVVEFVIERSERDEEEGNLANITSPAKLTLQTKEVGYNAIGSTVDGMPAASTATAAVARNALIEQQGEVDLARRRSFGAFTASARSMGSF